MANSKIVQKITQQLLDSSSGNCRLFSEKKCRKPLKK